MNVVVGTTTVTHAAAAGDSVATRGLALVWRFRERARRQSRFTGTEVTMYNRKRRDVGPIQFDGTDVSRRHAALRKQPDGRVTIVDLGSHNGVRVDGRKVAEAPLGLGMVVRSAGGSALSPPRPAMSPRSRPDSGRGAPAGDAGACAPDRAQRSPDRASKARPAPARRSSPARSTAGAAAPVPSSR